MKKLPIKSLEENEFLTKLRKTEFAQKGEIRKVKRRYSKRVRRDGKAEILKQE